MMGTKRRQEEEDAKKTKTPSPKFPSPFGDVYNEITNQFKCKQEINMIALSRAIRQKKNWPEKLKNPEIVKKWRNDANPLVFTASELDYIFDELNHYASRIQENMHPSLIEKIWQSDNLISNDLKFDLIKCGQMLENVDESEKDWHPGSNGKVLNLIHPSLYCYVIGRSKYLETQIMPSLQGIGGGLPKESESISLHDYFESKKYQWLPSVFNVNDNGKVTIDSYINNLHPVRHKEMYKVIASIFEKFVPMFQKVLVDITSIYKNRIDVETSWYTSKSSESEGSDDSSADESENIYAHKKFIPPSANKFEPPIPRYDIQLNGKKLNVIVKMANIMLTPENPTYEGGTWHVEGMKNEKIVASGIYYYSQENITTSTLSFRQAASDPSYPQDDHEGVKDIFGLKEDDRMNENLGGIETIENRCLVFPNIYQHCVSSFKLDDPSKPGHRKILVFFLCNPTKEIINTSNVPPQRKDWYLPVLCKVFWMFPREIVKHIISYLDWPMDLNEAREHREELMKERKYFTSVNTKEFYEREFSLCEH
jgi:hypothetical protein